MHLEKSAWLLLRGKDPDVRKMAALLGFNYEQIDSGEFMHSNLVTVLDTRGKIVHKRRGDMPRKSLDLRLALGAGLHAYRGNERNHGVS